MRIFAIACLVSLAGCIIDNDPLRVDSLTANTAETFTYSVQTNTVMTTMARQSRSGAAGSLRSLRLMGCAVLDM